MALNSSIKVAMPEHGAVKRKMGDIHINRKKPLRKGFLLSQRAS